MLHRNCLLILCTLGLLSCGTNENGTSPNRPSIFESKFPKVENSVYGGWNADWTEFDDQGVARFLTVYFNKRNQMGVSLTCIGVLETLTVEEIVKVKITPTSVRLLSPLNLARQGRDSAVDCSIHWKGSIQYSVRGDQLYLKRPEQNESEPFSRLE